MKIWEEFLQNQVKDLGAGTIEKWAKSLKIVHFDAGNLYLEAADAFQVSWFEEYLRPKVQKFFKNNNQRPIKVHLSLASAFMKPKKIWKPVLQLAPDPVDPASLLETYYPGKTNTLHFSLFKETLQNLSFNPIYLYGPSGCGKSHLLMGATSYLQAMGKTCLYIKAGTLTQHIVAAIRSSSMPKLRQFYRGQDALIIDDIHLLANRTATQEEFFHTFNALSIAGKQIILSGNDLPSRLGGIEPRLTSRFEWGITLPFFPLSTEELKELVHQRSSLPKEIQDDLAAQFTTVADLLKASEILKKKKDFSDMGKWLAPLLSHQKQKAITPEKIVQITAELFEISSPDILGKGQTKTLSLPRQIAMYFCRKNLKMPFLKIAEFFSRDHSTVMTSVKSVEKKIKEQNTVLLSYVNAIESKLRS